MSTNSGTILQIPGQLASMSLINLCLILYPLAHAIDGVDIEEISCDVLNMEFFDRLWVRGVVRDGEMVKSKPDRWGDIPCADDVRKVGIN